MGNTKQVRLKEEWRGFSRNKVVVVVDIVADALVKQGKAEYTVKPKPPVKEVKKEEEKDEAVDKQEPEIAAVEVPEKAIKKRGRPRKIKR